MPDNPTHDTAFQLSPAGRARRAAMLLDLQRAVGVRGRRRFVARAAILALPLLALAVGATVLLRTERQTTDTRHGTPIAVDASPDSPSLPDSSSSVPALAIGAAGSSDAPAESLATEFWAIIPRAPAATTSRIRTATPDTTLLSRALYRGHVEILPASDDDLALALRASGHAAGLARTPDGVRILADRRAPSPAS